MKKTKQFALIDWANNESCYLKYQTLPIWMNATVVPNLSQLIHNYVYYMVQIYVASTMKRNRSFSNLSSLRMWFQKHKYHLKVYLILLHNFVVIFIVALSLDFTKPMHAGYKIQDMLCYAHWSMHTGLVSYWRIVNMVGVCRQWCDPHHIAQIAPLSFQGSHRTQTQTSEVRSAARFSGHWVVTSMFA